MKSAALGIATASVVALFFMARQITGPESHAATTRSIKPMKWKGKPVNPQMATFGAG